MKKCMVALAVGCAAVSALAYQSWSGRAGNNLLSDPNNWGNRQSPIYGEDGDANLGGFPTGTYTLNADMTANRIVFDRVGTTATFDLGAAHTLTLVGQEQLGGGWSFGVTSAGSNSTLRLVSGCISAPWMPPDPPQSMTNCYFKIGRESAATNFTFVVDGPNSKLNASRTELSAGNYDTLVITNGGALVADEVNFGATSGALMTSNRMVIAGKGSTATVEALNVRYGNGHGVTIADGGVCTVSGSVNLGNLKSDGNYIRIVGPGSLLTRAKMGDCVVGSSIWATNARLEVLDGGSIANINLLSGSGNDKGQGSGHLIAFRGARTDVTLTPSRVQQIGQNGANNCRLEVTDGATLRLGDPAAAANNNNRFWVSNNSNGWGNVVLVGGAGSKLVSNTAGNWLVGQHGHDSSLVVADGGAFVTGGGVTVGQGDAVYSRAHGNLLRVEGGASFSAKGVNVGWGKINGFSDGADLGDLACSNRFEVVSGGIVTNISTLTLGHEVGANDNAMLVSGGTYVGNGNCFIGRWGGGNRLTVADGGVFTNKTGYVRVGENNALTKGSNTVEILSGAVYAGTKFELYGYNPQLVVSNGLLVATENIGIAPDSVNATNATVIIAGANPRLRAGTYMNIRNGTDLRFSIPAEGYGEPVFTTVTALNIYGLRSVTYDISPALIDRRERITLARAGGNLNIDEQSMAALSANLPAECRIVKKGNELILKAGLKGLTLLFR